MLRKQCAVFAIMIVHVISASSYTKSTILKKKVSIPHHPYAHHCCDLSDYTTPPPITIWIHGTRFIRRPIFQSFFNGKPSLKLAQELAPDYYLHHLAHALNRADPKKHPLKTMYLFGWSGKLNAIIREQAAIALYDDIATISTEYETQYGIKPIIRIIGHSHGGNVALNLAKIKKDNPSFIIEELVLLACPVQQITKSYIEDEMFKRTYALYSTLDMVQVLAPQMVYTMYRTKRGRIRSEMCWPPLSSRRFNTTHKLSQVKIKINGRALFHSEFTGNRFAAMLPHILHVIDSWHNNEPALKTNQLLCVYTKPKSAINSTAIIARA